MNPETLGYLIFAGLAIVGLLDYYAIHQLTKSKNLDRSQKRTWMFIIYLIPIGGGLFYFFNRRKIEQQ